MSDPETSQPDPSLDEDQILYGDEQPQEQQQQPAPASTNAASSPDSIFPEDDSREGSPVSHSVQPSEPPHDKMDLTPDEPKQQAGKPSNTGPFTMDDTDEEDDPQPRIPHPASSTVGTTLSPPSSTSVAVGQTIASTTTAPTDNTASQQVGAVTESQAEAHSTAPSNPLQNIDLQALLSKLSPPVGQQSPALPQQNSLPPSQPTPPPNPTSSSIPTRPDASSNDPSRSPVSAIPSPSVLKGHASLPAPPHLVSRHKPGSSVPSVHEDEDEDREFTEAEAMAYEEFLAAEREYVSKGQWDRFPPGSRLFIGNLPTEKVTKKDLFRIFSRHGRLAQISIKQAYGFIQFLDVQSCENALRAEEGTPVRGRRMHLEVSKPQKNTRPAEGRHGRSRSPDYRGPLSPRSRNYGRDPRDRDVRGGSHYVGPSGRGGRDSRDFRERDEYRRSPPPRFRGRDDYRPSRDRSRSRTPPPPRYRSRSPVADRFAPPSRPSHEVPEVQFIVSDRLDEDFIWFVRKPFMQRNIRNEVCYLSPRLSLDEVVKKMIVEGVSAVVVLNNQAQQVGRVTVQVFDRSGGGTNIRYETYENIEPTVAAEVVGRLKNAVPNIITSFGAQPHIPSPYSATPSFSPPSATPQPPQAANAQIAELIRSMDPATLQKFLATLQQNPNQLAQAQQPQQPLYSQQAVQPPVGQSQQQMQADLASLLAARGALPAAQPQPPQNQNQQGGYNAQNFPPNFANLLGQGGAGGNCMPNLFDALAQLKR